MGIGGKDEPQIAIIVILYNPTGEGGHQGGAVAAPVGGQILGEVLPYIEEIKGSKDNIKEEVTVPNITGLSIKEAEKILKELGLTINIEEKDIDKGNAIIKEQIPKEGIKVNKESKIIVKY